MENKTDHADDVQNKKLFIACFIAMVTTSFEGRILTW